MTVRELTTKADLKAMKAYVVKWIAGLLLIQAPVIVALIKLL
jgi:hypothetical protein